MDFLFHEISEKEKKEIQKQAKNIMDSFFEKLSKVKQKVKEFSIEREKGEKEEKIGEVLEEDKNFSREIMFENAPQKNDNFIIAEKGKW